MSDMEQRILICFANVTHLNKVKMNHTANLNKFHTVELCETYLRGNALQDAIAYYDRFGWSPIAAPASRTGRSDNGTHGGIILLTRTHIMSRSPIWVDPESALVPSDTFVWKIVRARGITFKTAVTYFEHSLGIIGPNIQGIISLTDNGRSEVAVFARFKMSPGQMLDFGVLTVMNIVMLSRPFDAGTCRTPSSVHGDKTLDYIFCTHGIAKLFGGCHIHHSVRWWPHYAISASINIRPTQIRYWTDLKPKMLPYRTDDKGDPIPHKCSQEIWSALCREVDDFDEALAHKSPSY